MEWDREILLFIQEHVRQLWMDEFWISITHLGDMGWIWIFLGIILLIPKKTRRGGVAALLALAIGTLITNMVLKNMVGRIRPYEVIDGLLLIMERQHDFSFPSGHTSASFAAALGLYQFLPKKWGILCMILAVLISLSRLYVGVHYPTDVIGGILVGSFSAWAAGTLVRRWYR